MGFLDWFPDPTGLRAMQRAAEAGQREHERFMAQFVPVSALPRHHKCGPWKWQLVPSSNMMHMHDRASRSEYVLTVPRVEWVK